MVNYADSLDRLEQLRLLGLGQLPEPEPETRPDDGFSRWAAELQAQAVDLGDRLLADLQAHPFDDGDIDRLFAEMAIPDPEIERLLTEVDRSCDALMAELAEYPFVMPEPRLPGNKLARSFPGLGYSCIHADRPGRHI
jgi:hypothetical protein